MLQHPLVVHSHFSNSILPFDYQHLELLFSSLAVVIRRLIKKLKGCRGWRFETFSPMGVPWQQCNYNLMCLCCIAASRKEELVSERLFTPLLDEF